MFDRCQRVVRVGAVDITVVDTDPIYSQLVSEIPGAYNFEGIEFQGDDVMIDVGAHVGLTSIYFAKMFPNIRIYAYEPAPHNYARLVEHVALNGTPNVRPHNLAVTSDGKSRELVEASHTAGFSAFHDNDQPTFQVQSTTMDAIFKAYRIDRVKLLKLDCEGAEFEILGTAGAWLDRVDAIRGEFHPNICARSEYDPLAVSHARVENVAWVWA